MKCNLGVKKTVFDDSFLDNRFGSIFKTYLLIGVIYSIKRSILLKLLILLLDNYELIYFYGIFIEY